jgi:hypothetical protein
MKRHRPPIVVKLVQAPCPGSDDFFFDTVLFNLYSSTPGSNHPFDLDGSSTANTATVANAELLVQIS